MLSGRTIRDGDGRGARLHPERADVPVVKARNRFSLKRSGFPSWPPNPTTVATHVITQASTSRLWVMVQLHQTSSARQPAARLDPGAGDGSRRVDQEEELDAHLRAERLLHRPALAIVGVEELVRTRQESLEATEVPDVVEIYGDLEAALLREVEIAADAQIDHVQRRQLELALVACGEGEAIQRGQRIRDDPAVRQRHRRRPELRVGCRDACMIGPDHRRPCSA